MTPLLDFSNKNVVLTGTASGMGAEALKHFVAAGAAVHSLDINQIDDSTLDGKVEPVHHLCDLGQQTSIDATLLELPDRIDAVVNCAGLPNGGRFTGEQVLRVNWLGLRHLTESLLPRMGEGAAVVHVASTAGRDWAANRELVETMMSATTFDEGLRWAGSNQDAFGDGYTVSKQAVQYYTMWRAVQLLPQGIRMNSVCPGVTNTPIIDDFRKGMGNDPISHATAVAGRLAEPAEMVPAMMFLADSAASSYLNGVNIPVDSGTAAARATGQDDPGVIWSAALPSATTGD